MCVTVRGFLIPFLNVSLAMHKRRAADRGTNILLLSWHQWHVANTKQIRNLELKSHQSQPSIYTLFLTFWSEEAGIQFFRVLMRRSAVDKDLVMRSKRQNKV